MQDNRIIMDLSKKVGGYIVLAVPQVSIGKTSHPGGQLTAANGLVHYLALNGIRYELLNTLARNYPPTSLMIKILQSLGRIYKGWRHAANANCYGYLAFSNFGLSFYERCATSLIFRLYRKPALIFFRSTEILEWRLSIFKKKMFSALLKAPSVVVSQGSLLKQELHNLGVLKVEVIPNWLPPDFSVAQRPKTYPEDGVVNFIYIGWLESAKGVPELLKAANLLRPLAKRFRIFLAGNGTLEQYVADEISKNQLTNVHHLGWLDNSDVINLLDCGHVFVLPSHTEGFPNVLLEAMSRGLPAISTRVGAIPDVLKHDDNGMLVNVSSQTDIVECMSRYINDRDLIPAHSRSAIETVTRFHGRDVNCEKLLSAFISANM